MTPGDDPGPGSWNRPRAVVVGTGVGIDALPGWIVALGLPPATLVIGTVPDDADGVWCVHPGPEGTWEVYWVEGGERYSWTRFDEEAAACFHLFGRLAWTQMMRGAIRTAG